LGLSHSHRYSSPWTRFKIHFRLEICGSCLFFLLIPLLIMPLYFDLSKISFHFFNLWVLHPVAHLSNWFLRDTCISNIDNTLATKKRQNNNRRKTSLHCPQLDHHDTALTIMRRYRDTNAHSSRYFNILYMGPVCTENFNDFYSFYICTKFDNMYWGLRVEVPM
jgi:hypothetical protein